MATTRNRKAAESFDAIPKGVDRVDVGSPERPLKLQVEMPSSSKKGGRKEPFTDDENIEVLTAYITGKNKLHEAKEWNKSTKEKRFKLMYATEFTNGKLKSGRALSEEGFLASFKRLKERFSTFSAIANKSGAGRKGKGSRLRLSDGCIALMEDVWGKDPAIIVDKDQLAGISGGMGSDDGGEVKVCDIQLILSVLSSLTRIRFLSSHETSEFGEGEEEVKSWR